MKKLLLCAAIIGTATAFAQEAATKKVNAGLHFGTGINFNKSATKRMDVPRNGTNLNIGVVFHYKMSNSIGFATGLDVDFDKNFIKPGVAGNDFSGTSYYHYSDTEILKSSDVTATSNLFQMVTREQKPIYLSIPTEMLFRTKFFGYCRFYGKFGLRTSFLMSNKINDVGFTFKDNDFNQKDQASIENNLMTASRDMNFVRSSVGFSLGGEWNFSGSTSLIFEAGYRYGFIPIYASNKEKNQTLYYHEGNNTSVRKYYSNSMTQNQLTFKLGILF